jgi:hypothetical protein
LSTGDREAPGKHANGFQPLGHKREPPLHPWERRLDRVPGRAQLALNFPFCCHNPLWLFPVMAAGGHDVRASLKQLRSPYFLSWPIAIVMAGTSMSQSSDVTLEARALHEVFRARNAPDDTTNDPKWSASLATALHRYCESVMAQLPRNTPDEDRWVDNELADINATVIPPLSPTNLAEIEERMARKDARLNRVFNSIENTRKQFREGLGDCLTWTKKLMELKRGSPAAEALLWVELSRFFMWEDEVWEMAEIVGLVSPKYCKRTTTRQVFDMNDMSSGHDENYICYWQYVVNTITLGAVIPLLKNIAKH